MNNNWKNKFWGNEAVMKTVILSLPKSKRGIRKVYFVEDLGGTPAKCLRSTGEMWIALKWWRKLPFEHKVFIILHENAHIVLNSSDEKEVDAYAHAQYLRMGYSITKSIEALTKVLSYSTEEHFDRTRAQFARAVIYDVNVNGNKKLLRKLINHRNKTRN